jgi:hypothetical protein
MSYNNNPYMEGGAGYNDSSVGFIQPQQPISRKKAGVSPWIKFGLPVLVVVAIAAVVGGILGTRKSTTDGDASSSSSGESKGGKDDKVNSSAPIATATGKLEAGRYATATQSKYMIPIYPSAVGVFSRQGTGQWLNVHLDEHRALR